MEADLATMEKKGMPTGLFVTHPLTGERVAGLGRQLRADGLRRRRGDGRAGARPARLRVREEVRPADPARSSTSTARPYSDRRRGRRGTPSTARCVNSGQYDGLDFDAAIDAIAQDLKAQGLGEQAGAAGACATGASRASATGAARSRSIHCAGLRRRAGARRPAAGACCPRTSCPTAPAIRSPSARRS